MAKAEAHKLAGALGTFGLPDASALRARSRSGSALASAARTRRSWPGRWRGLRAIVEAGPGAPPHG